MSTLLRLICVGNDKIEGTLVPDPAATLPDPSLLLGPERFSEANTNTNTSSLDAPPSGSCGHGHPMSPTLSSPKKEREADRPREHCRLPADTSAPIVNGPVSFLPTLNFTPPYRITRPAAQSDRSEVQMEDVDGADERRPLLDVAASSSAVTNNSKEPRVVFQWQVQRLSSHYCCCCSLLTTCLRCSVLANVC